MKYAAVIAALLIAFVPHASAASCFTHSSEAGCESANCFWCERCSGTQPYTYNLINSYGTDRCVESSLNCTYGCSTLCGSQCASDANCPSNLTDTDCFYAGSCSSCSCLYKQTDCPKPGTIKPGLADGKRVCYYGPRSCGSSGCSVETCTLKAGEICAPDGCTAAGGTEGEYLSDYRCSGSDLLAKKVVYSCNATGCLYNKTDALVEKCKNGCAWLTDAQGASYSFQCRSELCNIEGSAVNCNQLDGYYGPRFCKGKGVYQTYRDYSCGPGKCIFAEKERFQQSCEECYNGRCEEPGQIVTVNYSQGETQQQGNDTGMTATPAAHPGGRLYNGFFFGFNQIAMNARGTGRLNFTVQKTNQLGALTVLADGRAIFSTKGTGNYSIPFANTTRIVLRATSSGWIFFTPATYDLRNINLFIYANKTSGYSGLL